MAIPTQTDMNRIVLGLMQDGSERSRAEIRDGVAELLSLSKEERSYKTSSGKPVYGSRSDWSVSYLDRAQLLERVSRGVYRIAADGIALYASGLDGSDLLREINSRISKLDPWHRKKKGKKGTGQIVPDDKSAPDEEPEKSPQEQISDLADELNDVLGNELLKLIMDNDAAFFEKVVVELMEHMGYGKGSVTRYTNDGGIDGLITTDELGFRPIYTQAKRYAPENKVGRQTLQSFVGALNGAQDGVFITTSSFTEDALTYAKGYPGATLSLIDGKRLTELMIKYDLGVATESVIKIKRVDSDYFEDV